MRAAAAAADAHARARAAASARAARRHRHRAHGAAGAAELGPARRHRLRGRSGRDRDARPARAPSYSCSPGPSARDVRELGAGSRSRSSSSTAPGRRRARWCASTRRWRRCRASRSRRAGASEYDRIRREPADFCVSTIEALAEVLQHRSSPTARRSIRCSLPFRAMVDRQERFAARGALAAAISDGYRERAAPPRADAGDAPRRRLVAPRLHPGRGQRLAGAPSASVTIRRRSTSSPAGRRRASATKRVVAPRRPLAPLTPHHIELDARAARRRRQRRGVAALVGGRSARPRRRRRAVGQLLHQPRGGRRAGLAAAAHRSARRAHAVVAAAARRHARGVRGAARATVTPLGLDGRGGRRLAALVSVLGTICGAAR